MYYNLTSIGLGLVGWWLGMAGIAKKGCPWCIFQHDRLRRGAGDTVLQD